MKCHRNELEVQINIEAKPLFDGFKFIVKSFIKFVSAVARLQHRKIDTKLNSIWIRIALSYKKISTLLLSTLEMVVLDVLKVQLKQLQSSELQFLESTLNALILSVCRVYSHNVIRLMFLLNCFGYIGKILRVKKIQSQADVTKNLYFFTFYLYYLYLT